MPDPHTTGSPSTPSSFDLAELGGVTKARTVFALGLR